MQTEPEIYYQNTLKSLEMYEWHLSIYGQNVEFLLQNSIKLKNKIS